MARSLRASLRWRARCNSQDHGCCQLDRGGLWAYDSVEKWGFGVSWMLRLVQQPCSNPSKSPENQRKARSQEKRYLQGFCKLQKPPANHRAAFTRQRSLVRNQHRPLLKRVPLQVKP